MPELNFVAGVLLKPLVLVLTAWATVRLWPGRRKAGGRLFIGALATFAAGELFCASDVYVGKRMSVVGEVSHDVLMAVAAGLLLVAMYVHASARYRCWNAGCRRYLICRRLARDCRLSDRHGPMPFWLLGAAALMALPPMLAADGVQTMWLHAAVGGRSFGAYLYDRGPLLSFFEQRALPVLACLALVAAAARYRVRARVDRAVLWLAAMGAATLGFAWFRTVLVLMFFPDAAQTGFWEETAELVSIVLFIVWHERRASSAERRRTGDLPTRELPALATF